LPALGQRRVKDVTARDIEALHQARAKTPYRANRVLALLSSALSLAVHWGWRAENPAKGIERFYEEKRERYLTSKELERLVHVLRIHSNRRSANAVLLIAMTGARRGEALGATWDQFDLQTGVWTKPSSQTKLILPRRSGRV
jgi:integrase